MVLELRSQLLMGEIVFRRDDEAGGVPVDPVHNARPQGSAHAGERIPAVVEQSVDQRPVGMARRRMDHQPLGLVHHKDVPVLIDHIQRDVLGNRVQNLRFRQGDLHGLRAA